DGLRVESASPTISNLNIGEIQSANGVAIGTHLIGAVNTHYTTGISNTLAAVSCFGVLSTGDATGVIFDGVSANGCNALNSSSTTTVGVMFDNCPVPAATPAPIYRNANRITGGTAFGTGTTTGTAVGVAVTDGCALDI